MRDYFKKIALNNGTGFYACVTPQSLGPNKNGSFPITLILTILK